MDNPAEIDFHDNCYRCDCPACNPPAFWMMDSYPNWPSPDAGNDDTNIEAEDNIPYDEASYGVGTLAEADVPLQAIRWSDGAHYDYVRVRYEFFQFARMEIPDENGTWFRISVDFPWHLEVRLFKLCESETGVDANGDDVFDAYYWTPDPDDDGCFTGLGH